MQPATPEEMFELTHGRLSNDPSWFEFGDAILSPEDVMAILGPRMTQSRRARIDDAVAERTRSLVIVVEGMVDVGNVAAVMRTADAMGVQEVHAVDTAGMYKRSRRTTQGADKWLDRYRWETIDDCYAHLRDRGLTIVVADPDAGATPITRCDLTRPTAVVFGNELDGVSDEASRAADGTIVIPMAGLAESLNISVAVAVTMYEAQRQRVRAHGRTGDLSDADAARLRAVWYLKAITRSDLVVRRALADGYQPIGTR